MSQRGMDGLPWRGKENPSGPGAGTGPPGRAARDGPAARGKSGPPERGTVITPSAEFPPLDPDELRSLRRIGEQWRAALRGRPAVTGELPVDPRLGEYRCRPTPTGFGRLVPIELFRPGEPGEPDELVATEPANLPGSRSAWELSRLRRIVLGPPLSSAAVLYERMRKIVALPVLSSDLLSSVAYGPEAMLTVLVLAGSAALGLSLPLAAILVVLMIAVGVSYRQTIPAYPHGAGSYIVASDNLGHRPGLAAAAGLMMDYILTVSVSVAAGTHAVSSAVPAIAPLSVPIGLLVVVLLLAGNLRGVRSAGNLFAVPTYAFLAAVLALLVVGFVQVAGRGFQAMPPPQVPAVEGLTILVVLRALSSGATSMTGIEAVSNAVPAFRAPEWRNARTTLTWMVAILVVLFAGLVVLIHLAGLVPRPEQTLLSQLARHIFPTGPWYALIQAATALILLLAANTAFNDFPRLLFFMARDGYAPRRFLHLGDRLEFSHGLIALAVAAAVIFLAFRGNTESLIPLYAVGVFLAFTLSQAGMVVHWWRHRGRHWRKKLGLNALGAVLSGLILVTAAVAKFTEGAWVVVLAILLLMLICLRIRRHYSRLHRALALHPLPAENSLTTPMPGPARAQRPAGPPGAAPVAVNPPRAAGPARRTAAGSDAERPVESEEAPQQVRHLIVVPLARLNLAALRAMAYAASLDQPTLAVHLAPEQEEADRFREQWQAWGDHLWLETIVSPYRAVIAPLAHYLEALHAARPDLVLTVILPELVVRRRWHWLLHSRAEQRLRRALRNLPGVVVTSVPVHLPD